MFFMVELLRLCFQNLRATNFKGLELIRPLYYVEESIYRKFIQSSGIWPLNCACMVAAKKIGNKRHEIKAMIKNMKSDV